MSFTEEQKIFMKEKIRTLLPGSKIYLFYAGGNGIDFQNNADVLIFAERELDVEEIAEIRDSFRLISGVSGCNIQSYKFGFESERTRYIKDEGEEL